MDLRFRSRPRPKLSEKKEKLREARRRRARRGVKRTATGCRHPYGERLEPRPPTQAEYWPDGEDDEEEE